ncbi:E3 SUMO-protein ligase ZBED1-like [Diabrotica undecimpunctata]|uniref:E3 SUMO-protein ligase ZBED1-like n=1 Tax=Diabrotica undecimpunctata TaxID=50387 RepID=UPI003B6361C0
MEKLVITTKKQKVTEEKPTFSREDSANEKLNSENRENSYVDSGLTIDLTSRKRKRHSNVWNYFKRSADRKLAKCLTCGREYKTSGNTSNLADHIKRFHPFMSTGPDCSASTNTTELSTSSARSSAQSISPFFKRSLQYDSTSQRKKDLNHALTLMIATDLQAFNIVNDSGFKNFVNMLDPRYVLSSKFTIRETIMNDMYQKCVLKLKDVLKQNNFVSITTDSWTSVSTESYMAITCHYIDQNFNLKNSILAVTKLKEHHTAENLEVSTRWNSTFYMLGRIIETQDFLHCTLLKLRKAPHPITIDELLLLRELHECLECFEEATRKISGSTYPTISLIIPLTYGIHNHLADCSKEMRTEEGKQFCTELQHSVQNRLFNYEKRSITRIATIIDPCFKKEGFYSLENANQANVFLEQEICQILQEKKVKRKNTPNGDGETESAPKKSLFSFIGQKNQAKVKSNLADAIIVKKEYLKTPNANEDTDPLLFWKVTGEEVNPMAQLCQKYFCIPDTSVESERTFSRAGAIISDRRSRLKPKKCRNDDIA